MKNVSRLLTAMVLATSILLNYSVSANITTSYGPIQSSDTLWSIANKVRPDHTLSIHQVIWGLYQHNQQAFINADINQLIIGEMLVIPAMQDFKAIPRKQAYQNVVGENTNQQAQVKLVVPAPETPAALVSAPSIEQTALPKPISPNKQKQVSKSNQALEQDLLQSQRALVDLLNSDDELNARLFELEKELGAMISQLNLNKNFPH